MTVAAHLIVGSRKEPLLGALLKSLVSVADTLVVNENSGKENTENLQLILASPWAWAGNLYLDRTPFRDFATARNRCLALHRENDLGPWVAFVDCDEVHLPVASQIAAHLRRLPPEVDFVDGYTFHFFQSVDWYTTIERRMSFFRMHDQTVWTGAVHESLTGNPGKRLAIPYCYAHYGYILPVAHAAAKGRLYSRLGAPGATIDEADDWRIDRAEYFARFWPLALRFRGRHPPAATAVIASLRATYAAHFAETTAIITRRQTACQRFANVIRRANFEYRWRARALDQRAAALLR